MPSTKEDRSLLRQEILPVERANIFPVASFVRVNADKFKGIGYCYFLKHGTVFFRFWKSTQIQSVSEETNFFRTPPHYAANLMTNSVPVSDLTSIVALSWCFARKVTSFRPRDCDFDGSNPAGSPMPLSATVTT